MTSRRKVLSGMNRSRTIVFIAAPSSQILDVAGPFQIFVRTAELFVQENPTRKAPYNVLLANTTRRKSVATNCGLVLIETETETLRARLRGVSEARRDWRRNLASGAEVIAVTTGAARVTLIGQRFDEGPWATRGWRWRESSALLS
jgi:hypothetical protein